MLSNSTGIKYPYKIYKIVSDNLLLVDKKVTIDTSPCGIFHVSDNKAIVECTYP